MWIKLFNKHNSKQDSSLQMKKVHLEFKAILIIQLYMMIEVENFLKVEGFLHHHLQRSITAIKISIITIKRKINLKTKERKAKKIKEEMLIPQMIQVLIQIQLFQNKNVSQIMKILQMMKIVMMMIVMISIEISAQNLKAEKSSKVIKIVKDKLILPNRMFMMQKVFQIFPERVQTYLDLINKTKEVFNNLNSKSFLE